MARKSGAQEDLSENTGREPGDNIPDPPELPPQQPALPPAPTPMASGPSLPYSMLNLNGGGGYSRGLGGGGMNFGSNQTEAFLRYLESLRWQQMRGSMPSFNIFGKLG